MDHEQNTIEKFEPEISVAPQQPHIHGAGSTKNQFDELIKYFRCRCWLANAQYCVLFAFYMFSVSSRTKCRWCVDHVTRQQQKHGILSVKRVCTSFTTMLYLCEIYDIKNTNAIERRKKLFETTRFSRIIASFPTNFIVSNACIVYVHFLSGFILQQYFAFLRTLHLPHKQCK